METFPTNFHAGKKKAIFVTFFIKKQNKKTFIQFFSFRLAEGGFVWPRAFEMIAMFQTTQPAARLLSDN